MVKRVPLWFPFSLALLMNAFGSALFSSIHFFAFAPFLAILYNRHAFIRSLWLALLCGLIIDLFSSQLRLGVYSLNYCLTTILLYRQKKHFFEDKPLALSLFTALISSTSTLLQFLLLYLFDKPLSLSWKWVAADLVCMPAIDAAYAYAWFSCPLFLYQAVQRIGYRALLNKIASVFRSEQSQ